MANSFFQFKQFTVHHDRCAMKVTTDGCLFGAWVAREIANAKGKIETGLDIGTGSGLLSMMVAQQSKLSIDAVEIDKDAAQQAAENIAESPFKNIQVMAADIREVSLKIYDCIFSNPPFYEAELASPNQKRNSAHHSTDLDWDTLFRLIESRLSGDGSFYLLLPYKRQKEATALLAEHRLFIHKWVTVKPSILHPPFRLLVSGGRTEKLIKHEELAINNENGRYTPAFTALLKDYYLYL